MGMERGVIGWKNKAHKNKFIVFESKFDMSCGAPSKSLHNESLAQKYNKLLVGLSLSHVAVFPLLQNFSLLAHLEQPANAYQGTITVIS